MTVTTGLVMYSLSDLAIASRSSTDVRPAAANVADQRQRDLAVRPDLQRLRELRVLVDLDAQLVAGDQPVVRRGRGRGGGTRRRAEPGRRRTCRPASAPAPRQPASRRAKAMGVVAS